MKALFVHVGALVVSAALAAMVWTRDESAVAKSKEPPKVDVWGGRPEAVELVDRPTEGTLYETFSLLAQREGGALWVARGAGEGDFESGREAGYSGLAAALASEGYALRQWVAPAQPEIPDDVKALADVAPGTHRLHAAMAKGIMANAGTMDVEVGAGEVAVIDAMFEMSALKGDAKLTRLDGAKARENVEATKLILWEVAPA